MSAWPELSIEWYREQYERNSSSIGVWAARLWEHYSALEAKLEAYDHLLDCKLAWAWDMEQAGGSPIEVAAYMIRTIQDMRAAAQQERR